jgi:hypothetical protein
MKSEAVISDVLGVQSSQREARLSALTILMQTFVVCSWCLAWERVSGWGVHHFWWEDFLGIE